ncbi:ribonuclease P protein subunit p14 isoform X4 [Panthera tigris]|uniref:ribonuclease P protein subunit p14 isoform X4 n=1 Tax=Panthera leo TaxID=9689 RepID=UPI001C6A3AFA|nr:ribonuclease P protein subunit p14 isoform X4 [Panthera leo]XP_042835210.1 ribonuclease P protein subunit p14 isoform X4 [Panthera tigris]
MIGKESSGSYFCSVETEDSLEHIGLRHHHSMWSVLEKMPAPATTYERIVYKNPSEHHYMKVCLEFQDHGVGLNVAQFKQLLISALKDLFGEWSCKIVELFDSVGIL